MDIDWYRIGIMIGRPDNRKRCLFVLFLFDRAWSADIVIIVAIAIPGLAEVFGELPSSDS